MTNTLANKLKLSLKDIEKKWDQEILPVLKTFITIPNKSVMFDPQWKTHGYMDKAVKLITDWCHTQPIKDIQLKLIEEKGRTPLIYIDIPGESQDTVLLYGHLDKQPEMTGWDSDKGPWTPVLIKDKLYGRGSADDGYSVFAALTAIATLQSQGIPHARCVALIEASEESGSPDLVYYLNHLKKDLGQPTLIIALDSGCGNYEQLWSTTSLRGVLGGKLHIRVLREGMHSGLGSGVVPNVFMVLRALLDRIEDNKTGRILLKDLYVDIPEERLVQAEQAADILGTSAIEAYSWAGDTRPLTDDITELLLNRTWRPQLAPTGIDGVPAIENAGNVTLPELTVKLSFRLPPTVSPEKASLLLKAALEKDPPFGATVEAHFDEWGKGWNAPTLADWLRSANEEASKLFFGKPAAYYGEGGSIPFMGMLGENYPKAQFLITGVLGPHSNAHGPNEFLHLGVAKKLTACIAFVIAQHHLRNGLG